MAQAGLDAASALRVLGYKHVALYQLINTFKMERACGWADKSVGKVPAVEPEGPGLDPRHPCKRAGMVAHTWNSGTAED